MRPDEIGGRGLDLRDLPVAERGGVSQSPQRGDAGWLETSLTGLKPVWRHLLTGGTLQTG